MVEGESNKKRKAPDPDRVRELEEFLFGSDDPYREFGREGEAGDRQQEAAQLASQAELPELEGNEGPLFIWEDRGKSKRTPKGAQVDRGLGDEQDESSEEARSDFVDDSEKQDGGDSGQLQMAADAARIRSGGLAGTRKPVWEDPDDAEREVEVAGRNRLRKLRNTEEEEKLPGKEYEQRLRQLHARLHPRATWAKRDESSRRADSDAEDEQTAEELIAGAGPLLGRSKNLPPRTIEISRLKDANTAEPSDAVVRSVAFHPSGQLLLTAGLDKRIRFFQVDGVRNEKVQSIFLEDLPIHQAAFAHEGQQVVAVGRRKHFYILDLAEAKVERINHLAGCDARSLERFVVSPPGTPKPLIAFLGSKGGLPLVSLQSRQAVGHLKMSSAVRSAAFLPDGNQLLTSGKGGIVHLWDLRTQRCIHQQVDEGALTGTAIAVSPTSTHYATGSDSGVVNLYNGSNLLKGPGMAKGATLTSNKPLHLHRPLPAKSFLNLTTEIDSLTFSPDGQMMAMASSRTKDAMRLAHIPSQTIFENWPTANSPLSFIHSLAISPGGGLLAVGNARGRALLYRLHHYQQL